MPEIYSDVLEIIHKNELDKFYQIIASELPYSLYTYNFIKTCNEWRHKNSHFDVLFYSYREKIESGVFVGILNSGNKTFGLIIYALEHYDYELKHALLNTKKIPWHKLPLVQGILPRHYQLIEEIIREKNFTPKIYVNTTMQMIDINKAINFKIWCPNDVYISKLSINDIDIIYDLWPLKDVNTKDDIRYSIELSPSYGVYSKSNDELLAWVMQSHYGAVGMLYTKETVRRNGYAKILIQMISQKLAELFIQPYAMIMESNTKSLALFHSLGYTQITPMRYLTIENCAK